MAEILVKAVDATHPDPIVDARGCYKRGMAVVVMDDGHPWGLEERLPKFVVFKFPLVSKARVQKYLAGYGDPNTPRRLFMRRLWQVRWADLPLVDRNKLANTGQFIIKATVDYTGTFDRTWAQVKSFFRNLQTGLDETEDI